MATATIGRDSRNRLTPEQIAERKQAAAAAELQRNGITPPKSTAEERRQQSRSAVRELGLDQVEGEYSPPIAPLPSANRDFKSDSNAKPMGRSDIANVQFLNIDTAREIINQVAAVAPEIAERARQHVERQWADLLTESERFTLSAMAARKFKREQIV